MIFIFALVIFSAFTGVITTGCDLVEIVWRKSWGARDSLSNETMKIPVPHLFIHHTATQECNSLASCKEIMRAIQKFHMLDRGWDDIGYNFLIGGDGRVYEGRGWNRVGAHTYGFNKVSVAFSLMGDYSNKAPTELMLNTARNLVKCAIDNKHVTNDFKLHGHRDAGCTECPGNELYKIIQAWPRFQKGPLPGSKTCPGS